MSCADWVWCCYSFMALLKQLLNCPAAGVKLILVLLWKNYGFATDFQRPCPVHLRDTVFVYFALSVHTRSWEALPQRLSSNWFSKSKINKLEIGQKCHEKRVCKTWTAWVLWFFFLLLFLILVESPPESKQLIWKNLSLFLFVESSCTRILRLPALYLGVNVFQRINANV